MSETFVTPSAPTPAPSSAPAGPTDVPVSHAPATTPNPATGQAPARQDLPKDFKGSEHRPMSRREAIQEGFRKFERQRGEIKPAEAKPGHNNPPEETPRERAKPVERERPQLDLRKRPDDQPKVGVEGNSKPRSEPQPRAEHGHFAAREPAQQGDNRAQQQPPRPPDPNDPATNRLAATAAYREPPARWRDNAKAEWDKVPESVRGEVHRMHHEFDKAYQTYRADHEAMNELRPFAELAKKSNTTLYRALDNYLGMEMKLSEDLFAGLDHIINNLNLTTKDGSNRRVTLADVCWSYVNQTPEQHALIQQRNAAQAQARRIQQQDARIAELERDRSEQALRQQYQHLRGGVANFATNKPRFEELAADIAREISHGYDLETAYRRAEMLRPGPAAQTRTDGPAAQTRTPAPQTRTPDRSISGAPGGPSNGNGVARPQKQVSRRDAISNAIRQNGGLPS